jgi:hypothetical protein
VTALALRPSWHPRTHRRPSRRLTPRSCPQSLPPAQPTLQPAKQHAYRCSSADSQASRQPPPPQSGLNRLPYHPWSSPSGCAHPVVMKQVSTGRNSRAEADISAVSTKRFLAMVSVSRPTLEIIEAVQSISANVCSSGRPSHQRSRAWRNGLSGSSAARENRVMHDRNFRSSGDPKIA